MFKIFAKKAYRFAQYDGSQRVAHHDVPRGVIINVPDWVEKDPIFKMALKSGNISIISAAGNANLNAVDMLTNEAKSLGIKNPGTLTLDALQIAIAKVKEEADNLDELQKENSGMNGTKTPTKTELVAEATALGIDRPGRLTVPQLQEVIAQAKNANAQMALSSEGDDSGIVQNGDNEPK